jgi:D-sedoheptulose 7-phosphate isomerase
MMDLINRSILEHQFVLAQFKDKCADDIKKMAELAIAAINKGGKIIFFGNGGSAADSQHLATELMIRFNKNRRAIPALALTTDTSSLTACGNDFGMEFLFSRQLEGLASKNDIIIGLSTSGNSKNIVNALKYARQKNFITFALTGSGGGKCAEFADILLEAPSLNTARIQECHILAGHIFCDIIETEFANKVSEILV